MASVACADSLAFARSAALTWAAAVLLSTWRRIRPHTSRSHETVPLTLYCVLRRELPLNEDRADEVRPLLLVLVEPLPERVTSAFRPMVGNRPARAWATSATALLYCASNC